jgi:hypothetical protein
VTTLAAGYTVPAQAAVINATLNDDAWVQADGSSFNDNRLRVRDDATSSNIRKSFIEFSLPAIPAGEFLDSATFSVFDLETESEKNLGTSGERVVQVFGITDESVENFDEAAITYLNAPANVADGSSLDAAASVLLGSFDIGTSQTANSERALSNSALTSFLASDTNGIVTFALVSSDNNGQSTVSFGSSENIDGISAPALELVTVVPEPTSASLILIGGTLLGLRRRRD